MNDTESTHAHEVREHQRFEFGANWARFLELLDNERIAKAETSLRRMLGVDSLQAQRFLDAGSGSGLFSLAARRLGASVHSFDYDPQSVACTAELRRRYAGGDSSWVVEQASVLDQAYMAALPQFDVVYSWGVLHHTGAMWVGIDQCVQRVAPGGRLFIAIYNDQGWKSHFWWFVKWLYNRLPAGLDKAYAYTLGYLANAANILKYTLRGKPMTAIRPLLKRSERRGMSVHRDMIDWMGGFPFEFASYDTLADYLRGRGFRLLHGQRNGSLGCHEMVFVHTGSAACNAP